MRQIIKTKTKYVKPTRRVSNATPLVLLLLLVFATVASGIYYGGYVRSVMAGAGRTIGLENVKIEIIGNVRTTRQEIILALGIMEKTNLANFDTGKAYENISQLSWVRSAQIATFYPDEMKITIKENVPYGVWEYQGVLNLIGIDGEIIQEISKIDYLFNSYGKDLHYIKGMGAPLHAKEIISLVNKDNILANNIAAYVRVGNRRWDLKLSNGINIMLPQNDIEQALQFMVEANQEHNLYGRPLRYIDLRLSDRIALGLTAEAMKSHSEKFENNAKSQAGRVALNETIIKVNP